VRDLKISEHFQIAFSKREVLKISEQQRGESFENLRMKWGDLKINRFLKIENLTDFQYFKNQQIF